MKYIIKISLIIFFAFNTFVTQSQESKDYLEFDDRKNIVHGVYFGLGMRYGIINGDDTAFGNFKIAYVANKKVEIGFALTALFNEKPNDAPELFSGSKIALIGGYGGLHVEPILFGKKFISVSFPLLIGGGVVTYTGNRGNDEYRHVKDDDFDDFDDFFVVEPGINVLYNFSRFTQLETGIKYRFTSQYNHLPYRKGNLNGFSVGVGLKIGIFNLGRKKKIKDNF